MSNTVKPDPRSSDQTVLQPQSALGSDQTIPLGDPQASDRTVVEKPGGPAMSAGAIAAGAFTPGRKIGPYEVVRLLGRGSMGVVLVARHTELAREVALKVLAAAMTADPDAVERFRRESEAVARLDHPGIVRLFERGQDGDLHYYAMELVKGTSLDNVLRRERLPYVEAARVIAQCAHAIDFAHGSGVLHRDLKPGNILLEESGKARITDFGLARLDQKATLTSEGTVVGTPLYLAPEVASGTRASRRSDIYALGATLYELATGKPPYEGRDARTVMIRVLNEPPMPPTDADPRIPKDLVRIIGKAMARKPEERYATARALALDLEKFAQGRALEISGAAGAFKESAALRAGKRVAVTVGLAALILGTAGFVVWQEMKRKKLEKENQQLAQQLAQGGPKKGTARDPALAKVEDDAMRAAGDRDVRARTALGRLTDDAADARAKKSFDDLVARAREAEKEGSAELAATLLREALGLFPHRWETRLELARLIGLAEPDEAENELTMVLFAKDASKELQAQARLARGRLYRARGERVQTWLARTDLGLLVAQRAVPEALRVGVGADLGYLAAELGEMDLARQLVEGLPPDLAGDDLVRGALARAAYARAKGETSAADAELARAREAAASEEGRKLVEAYATR